MITDVFLDQKRVNVCDHRIKMALCDSFGNVPPEWVQDRKDVGMEGDTEWKSSEVNTRAVSRGQNELIG